MGSGFGTKIDLTEEDSRVAKAGNYCLDFGPFSCQMLLSAGTGAGVMRVEYSVPHAQQRGLQCAALEQKSNAILYGWDQQQSSKCTV
jgi:hypothetical protein